jgi:hypothetical protein
LIACEIDCASSVLEERSAGSLISGVVRRRCEASTECFAVQVGLCYEHLAAGGLALAGCANDVESFASFFRERGVMFSSHVVCSDAAVDVECTQLLGGTMSDILCALKMTKDAMDRSVAREKCLFFNFSGHGTQVEDLDGDEEDGFDEALCPSDFDTAGTLTDDALCKWLESLPAHRLFAVCDWIWENSMVFLRVVAAMASVLRTPAMAGARRAEH